MTTDSGLTITGDAYGNLLALDTSDGKTLWHAGTGSPMQSSPISYELDGRQYIMTSSGSVLFAWALPESHLAGSHNATRQDGRGTTPSFWRLASPGSLEARIVV